MDKLTLVVFGITSNLSQLKIIPALYGLEGQNLLPKKMRIIGVARSNKSADEFKQYLNQVLSQENPHHKLNISQEISQRLLKRFSYFPGHVEDKSFYPLLKKEIDKNSQNNNILYYLATYPNLYEMIFKNLNKALMNIQSSSHFVRIVIEKPIGTDLDSSKRLNQLLEKYFKEDQIYRLDHYLGKETLQNILTFRFANNIFENLINKDYIDHIQISAIEDFGIGKRGGYYDSVGALKDVGQNHLLQMIAFGLMERPFKFSNEAITKERIKVIEKLTPIPDKIVFGQYKGYIAEENVAKNSKTDTYFAFKTFLNNERFKDVPIYVRAGKMLAQTVTEISIVFKGPNILIYRIRPNEGIVLKMLTKKAGHTQELEESYMQYCYKDFGPYLPDAYEKLLINVFEGDQTFFNDSKEVEAAWQFIDPLADARDKPLPYEPGSYGPKEADKLIEEDGRSWLKPSMLFCKI